MMSSAPSPKATVMHFDTAKAPLRAAAIRPFPSLTISRSGLSANGTFAESQMAFLSPDGGDVATLDGSLAAANMGVVAHFYMDPELQGVLAATKWPHVTTSDSLAMGDAAIKMVKEGGVTSIACLGVDFMAESVRAMMDAAGLQRVPVYRLSKRSIGCSLAESAELPAYAAWLGKAQATPKSLHVVYINTSLVTKAHSQALVPTLTCTSSNVVKTVLQAFAQVPGLTVWYGPDTYMGENLRTLFESVAQLDDAAIAKLHPAHSRRTVEALLGKFEVFPQGNCVVHHMFGDSVAAQVAADYGHAYHTAHLEVPGGMFAVANEAASKGRGVVGSTSDILNFIVKTTCEALAGGGGGDGGGDRTLSFVLGTEAGMVTPIVRQVQAVLAAAPSDGPQVNVEVVFPVAADAVAPQAGEDPSGGLAVVPGAGGGEGCSAAGGCATCPFMKMNSLDALVNLADAVAQARPAADAPAAAGQDDSAADVEGPLSLRPFLPLRRGAMVAGRPAAELGGLPILHMRGLAATGQLPQALVDDILAR